MPYYELNLDGLVGPTHHYAGLSWGNLASTHNALTVSNPQAAALQGIAKMRLLHRLGLKQGLLPPHARPNLSLLSQLGFRGTVPQQLQKAYREALPLLSACFSASSMWAANTATVSSSLDTDDGLLHFTPANLISHFHRHQEADFSSLLLEKIFANPAFFTHHPVLPRSDNTSDEGAANHCRLSKCHQTPGLNLYVYGKEGFAPPATQKFPARQTLEASQSIARAHQLNPERVIFAKQKREAIDAGVFHNDVIALSNENILLIHEYALVNQSEVIQEIKTKANFVPHLIEISNQRFSLAEAVKTYFFNSQLISMQSQKQKTMTLIAPTECQDSLPVQTYINDLIADPLLPISSVHYLDLKQSMRNGGGPACLRLRVLLNEAELNAMHQGILITDSLLEKLEQWVMKHYRTHLQVDDLKDPKLVDESFAALDELTALLHLGSIYPFQREHS